MGKKESKLESSLQIVHILDNEAHINFIRFLQENKFKSVIDKNIIPRNYTESNKPDYQEFNSQGLLIYIRDKKIWYVSNDRSDSPILSPKEFVREYKR